VDVVLETLRTSAAQVWDLVLGSTDKKSSLAATMSTVAELLEGWMDATAANRVRWGSCSALVTDVSHFPELKAELEVLSSECNTDLTKDEADAL
jgi:hypothetical protein